VVFVVIRIVMVIILIIGSYLNVGVFGVDCLFIINNSLLVGLVFFLVKGKSYFVGFGM